MTSRERILNSLRANPRPFPDVQGRPESYLPVTALKDGDRLTRFTAEVERLTGRVYCVDTPDQVADTVLSIIGEENRQVLAWSNLPSSLLDRLSASPIEVVRTDLHTDTAQRQANLVQAETIRVGITGADAGFATTGTLALVTTPDQARLPSLLPLVHICLLATADLYDTLEAWMQTNGREALHSSSSVAFITGPSRTSDIEMQLILGVHGPRDLHVVVY